MEGTEAVTISRKKQGVFWSAVGYATFFTAIIVLVILMGLVDPAPFSAFIAVRLPIIVMLVLVMPTGSISALALMAGFSFLVITDLIGIFWGEHVDLIFTLPFALAGLAFAIRSYAKVKEKAKGHIWSFVFMLGGMFFWLWFAGWSIGTIDTLATGTLEEKSDAIRSIWFIVGIPILVTVLGVLGKRKAK